MRVDKNVGVGEELAHDDAAALCLEVQGNALLARVEMQEEAALVVVRDVTRERAEAAGVVALRRLYLDDVRAEVSEQLRAVWAGDPLREIDDANAFEGEFGQAGVLLPCAGADDSTGVVSRQ